MKRMNKAFILLMMAVLCLSFYTGCQTGIPMGDETKAPFVNPYDAAENACLAHRFVDGICSQCDVPYVPSEGLSFSLSEDGTGYLVNGIGECKDTQIMIPATYEQLPVLGLMPRALQGAKEVTYVHLPEGATGIGEWALQDCVNLRRIEIPPTVNHIGREAFSGCLRLSEIVIPEGVLIISNATFRDCVNLTTMHLPSTLSVIDQNAFENCRSMTEISIPESVLQINAQAFKNCDGLTAVRYDGTIDGWCSIEFDYDDANPVEIAKHLYIGEQLVEGVLTIPEGVVTINRQALMGIADITAVILPESIQTTGSFAGCEQLEYIVFKGSPINTGDTRVFANTSLAHVYLSDTKDEARPYIAYLASACKENNVEFHYSDEWAYDDSGVPQLKPTNNP